MEQRYYYIYIITNTINQKSYVGSRLYDRDNDEYVNGEAYYGSSKYLDIDISAYGIWNFKKDIIEIRPFINKNEIDEIESLYMDQFNTLYPYGYNKYKPSERYGFRTEGCHYKLSEESKYKIGLRTKGKTYNELYGENAEQEKQKRSIANKGKSKPPRTKEHALKIGIANSKKLRGRFKGKTYEERYGIITALNLKLKHNIIIICPHCKKSGLSRGMKRWHFNNCKYKPN